MVPVSCAKRRGPRLLRTARSLGYRPNDLAQSPHRARSMTVGLLTNDLFGRFSFLLRKRLSRSSPRTASPCSCNATDDPARERAHIDQLMRVPHRWAGGHGSPCRQTRADRAGRCADGLCVHAADDPDAICLIPDDEGGAVLATEHLISQGRKRIAHIAGPERSDAVRLRRAGHPSALATAGLRLILLFM